MGELPVTWGCCGVGTQGSLSLCLGSAQQPSIEEVWVAVTRQVRVACSMHPAFAGGGRELVEPPPTPARPQYRPISLLPALWTCWTGTA